MTRNIETDVLVKTLFKHFQVYLRIAMDIDVYSLAGVQLVGRKTDLPCYCLKSVKYALILEKDALIVSIFGLNF